MGPLESNLLRLTIQGFDTRCCAVLNCSLGGAGMRGSQHVQHQGFSAEGAMSSGQPLQVHNDVCMRNRCVRQSIITHLSRAPAISKTPASTIITRLLIAFFLYNFTSRHAYSHRVTSTCRFDRKAALDFDISHTYATPSPLGLRICLQKHTPFTYPITAHDFWCTQCIIYVVR